MLTTSSQRPANGRPSRYSSCGIDAKFEMQASTEPSSPKRRNEYTLPAASLASIQWKPFSVVSRDHSAGTSR